MSIHGSLSEAMDCRRVSACIEARRVTTGDKATTPSLSADRRMGVVAERSGRSAAANR